MSSSKRKQTDIGSFFSKKRPSESSTQDVGETAVTEPAHSETDTVNSEIPSTCPTSSNSKKQQVRKFQNDWLKKYPWLQFDEAKNAMYCELCRNANKDNVMSVGTDNFRTSTITRHVSHPDHQTLLIGKTMRKSTELAFKKTVELESNAAITAMKALYYIAKEHLPLSKYPSLIQLFRDVKAEHIENLQGGEATKYESSYSASEFLEAISDYFVEEINQKIANATVISILCDESTDIANHKKIAIWARVINVNNQQPVPETVFLCDRLIDRGDAHTVAETIKMDLLQRGVPMSKVMGLGTDGATVMTGQNKGVAGLFLRENPLMLNVHCLAHRLALVTSQAAQSFQTLKDFQQTLTNLFYYFNKSSNKVQTLSEIQKVLELPLLKMREIHEVRWLSFFEALLSVYRSLPALIVYFDSIKKQKDPKGEGIGKKLASKKFIFLTCMMLDVMTPVMKLSQQFQKQDLDPALVSVHIESCKTALIEIRDGKCKEGAYLGTLDEDLAAKESTYKGYKVDMSPEPASLTVNFVNKIIENIDKRFPNIDILNAFGILGMKPVSVLDKNELTEWGNEKLDILVKHYGESQTHTWKEDGENCFKTADPFIKSYETKIEWDHCKRVVLAEMFPRDNMAKLWQLIIQYHKDDFPNLIKFAALALTCPTNTADCERSFSVQNYITCQRRANISAEKCDQLMRICICGPKHLSEMNFQEAVKIWQLKKKRLLFSKNK